MFSPIPVSHSVAIQFWQRELDIDVKPMGEQLSQRLESDWKVLTF